MKNLILDKISSQELADWFGLAYSTYRKKAKKLLEELTYYCDFEKYHGGVEVKEIYVDTYIKNLASEDSEVYLNLVDESKDNICSLSGMARKLQYLYPNTWGQYSFDQIIKRLTKAGIALFGKTNYPVYRQDKQEERYSGPYGYREYCWAIKEDNYNKYRFLTKEEDEIFGKLLDSYNISSKDIALKEYTEKQLKKELLEGTLTKEEYVAISSQMEFFPMLLKKFKELTGLTLVHATYHDILESIF